MSGNRNDTANVTRARGPWRETEALLVIVLVVLAYGLRIGDVPMRGEEPTRAVIAFGMLDGGDWVVPRVQGEPFLSRPPLQNWLIAASSFLCGSRAAWAVRLPSVLAMIATALFLYGYARTCLSRPGALAAAAVFATFGEMFTTGSQAETDMIFTFLVSASLLTWHWGEVRGWPAARTWMLSYTWVALAVLCKGPQPPVYFFGAVGSYLILTGQARRLLTWAHLAGVLSGAAVVLAWAIPCVLAIGGQRTWALFMNDSTMRFRNWDAMHVGLHLVRFPLEVFGCTLPWSFLLLGFASRDFRQGLASARPHVLFMALCVGVAFPTIWLPPNGQTRYFTPLYPCLAMLIGIVIESCLSGGAVKLLRDGWRWFTQGWALAMVGLGLAVVFVAVFVGRNSFLGSWAERPSIAVGYATAMIFLAALVYRGRLTGAFRPVCLAVLALASFMVLTCAGYATNVRIRLSEDYVAAVAHLKEQLPSGQRLVSFGQVDLVFPFYYGRPIDRLPVPVTPDDPGPEQDVCFCFDSVNGRRPTLPFAWQELSVIPMDRYRASVATRAVVVGRRVPGTTTVSEKDVNTFSIVAFDPDKKEWGVAVASKYLAVGSVVPWAKAGVGAVATQARVNIAHGANGLELLAKGLSAEEVLKALGDSDKQIQVRQLGVVDAEGKASAFTGKDCLPYAGHKTGKYYACQGNILAGEAVIDNMAKAFEETKGPLPWRMMAALESADKAGGDKRGKQSAAILIVRDKAGPNGVGDRYLDLRVDDHKEPVPELARILSLRIKRPPETPAK